MVGYNQDQPDVWGSFAGGMQIGGALRRQQQQQEYGQAYQQSGWEGVRDTAGGYGDLETAQSAQGVMDDAQETSIARAQRSAEVLSNAATSLMGVPYEQRMARVQQMAPMLAQMGIDEAQLAQFDPTDENLDSIRALQGQFSRFSEIREGDDGAILGVMPDGQVQVLREPPPPAWGPLQQFNGREGQQNSRTGEIQFAPRGGGGGMGDSQYGMLDPAEVEQLGLPPGSYQRNNETGQVTVVGRTRGQYTEGASAAAQFASRMAAADRTLTELEQLGVDRTGVYIARFTGGSQDERRVRQSQREFVNAILRRESGAVISDGEFRSAEQQYFPVVGDGPEVIEQKRQARQRALQGLINASQGAYDEWYGEGSGAETPPPPPPVGGSAGAIVGAMGAQPRVGSSQIPGGIPQEEWDNMTPEEQRQVMDILGAQ